jgi:hemolysin III
MAESTRTGRKKSGLQAIQRRQSYANERRESGDHKSKVMRLDVGDEVLDDLLELPRLRDACPNCLSSRSGCRNESATSMKMDRIEVAPIFVYVIGLVTMLACSAAYNMWPVSPAKWVLRRFDHSAIYLLIAGTYTPFLVQMKSVLASASFGIGVWLSAVIGIALKLALPGRFDRLAIALCLLLGWSGVIAYDSLASTVPSLSLWLLAIGGILYSLGTLFHVWQRLRFHNAIWHAFVLLAASCHYSAVLACLPWA